MPQDIGSTPAAAPDNHHTPKPEEPLNRRDDASYLPGDISYPPVTVRHSRVRTVTGGYETLMPSAEASSEVPKRRRQVANRKQPHTPETAPLPGAGAVGRQVQPGLAFWHGEPTQLTTPGSPRPPTPQDADHHHTHQHQEPTRRSPGGGLSEDDG